MDEDFAQCKNLKKCEYYDWRKNFIFDDIDDGVNNKPRFHWIIWYPNYGGRLGKLDGPAKQTSG